MFSSQRSLAPRRAQEGLGLVELMVAVVIGLVGMVALFQLSKMAEGQRRTTTSGSDAQTSGTVALYMIQSDLRQAGYGLNWNILLDCGAVNAYDATRAPSTLPVFPVTPVLIDAAVPATSSDTVTVLYSSSQKVAGPVRITANMANATDDFTVSNRFGYTLGDRMLVAQTGLGCAVAQVSGLPTGNNNIEHTSGTYPYNAPGAFNLSFNTGARVFNLGPSPVRNVYRVDSNNLVVSNVLDSDTSQVLASQIVQMRAQYCKDTNGDNSTDTCDTTTPTTAAGWRQVLSVRVGLVARSAQPEKPFGGGVCDATTTAPTWQGGSFDLTASADWQCYRYRVFETLVPLRNQIWFQT